MTTHCQPSTCYHEKKKPAEPLPEPTETHTRLYGYRFGASRVWVVMWYPRVTITKFLNAVCGCMVFVVLASQNYVYI